MPARRDEAAASSPALELNPAFDEARPQCVLCNPDPGRRYSLKRLKLISELDRPHWKCSLTTVSNEICERCVDEFGVLQKLAANEERKAAKQKSEQRLLEESACPECGKRYESLASLRSEYCTHCAQNVQLLPTCLRSLIEVHDFVIRHDHSQQVISLALPDDAGQWSFSYADCRGRNAFNALVNRLIQVICEALDQRPRA